MEGPGNLVSGCFPQQTYCKVQETGPGSQNENDRQRICKSCIRLKVQDPRNPIPVSASPTEMKTIYGVHTYRIDLDLSQRNQSHRSSNHTFCLSLLSGQWLAGPIMTKVNNDHHGSRTKPPPTKTKSRVTSKKDNFRFGTDRSPIGMNAD